MLAPWAVSGTEYVFVERLSCSVGFEERWEALNCNSMSPYVYATGFLSLEDLGWLPSLCAESPWFLGDGCRDSICLAWHALLQGHESQTRRKGHHQSAAPDTRRKQYGGQGRTWAECWGSLLWDLHHGSKTRVAVNANARGHVTIRVRVGQGGAEKSLGETLFPGIFRNGRRSGRAHRETHFLLWSRSLNAASTRSS